MELTLTRNWSKPTYTIGNLFDHSGKRICNTLEPAEGSGKGLPRCNERISAGRYELLVRYSPSQRRNCIWLTKGNDDSFNSRYILIHAGNSAKDTKGCILLGFNTYVGMLSSSKATLEKFENYIIPYIKRGRVFLNIKS